MGILGRNDLKSLTWENAALKGFFIYLFFFTLWVETWPLQKLKKKPL